MSKNLEEISSQVSEICEFYARKTILITGAAGFLGSVLLETFLRCCPKISRIYILLRPKKGVQAEDRKDLIFKKDIFINLKESNPDVLEKVTVVCGDTSEENLGLNEKDYNNLTNEVSIVFHMAAAISFIKPLSFIVRQNVISTSNLIDFCRTSRNLEALVYTSSVFSGSNQKSLIEEQISELPFSPEDVIKFERNNNEDELMRLFHMCSPLFPNYYTFSKCVSENLLKETAQDLPVCIIRPSIVFCSLKGPLPGYVERGSAIADLVEGTSIGFIRVLLVDGHKRIAIIPADVVANSHIVAAFQQVVKRLPSPYIYNCVTGELSSITWSDFIGDLIAFSQIHPVSRALLYPKAMMCKNRTFYGLMSLIFHYIPGVTTDFILWISGSKFRLLKVYKFYDKGMRLVEFFTMHDWDMQNQNFQSLSEGLNALDKEIFCMDLKDFTIDGIKRSFATGPEFYRVNGKPFEDKLKWKFLRYFLTFLYVSYITGSTVSILYLVSILYSYTNVDNIF